jgi:arginyl-tRNA synthetase
VEIYFEKSLTLLQNALSSVLGDAAPTLTRSDLEIPPDPSLGEIAFPCFKLAKLSKTPPPVLAQKLVDAIQSLGQLPSELTASTKGPYVNFFIRPENLFQSVLKDILEGSKDGEIRREYGQLPPKSRGRWVLEYSSPNIAKPFQIYHLRPTALGACLARVGRYRGFEVITINHLGDWGTQYGKLATAFKYFGNDLPADPTINDLVNIYVKFHKLLEEKPELEDEARAAFARLEQKDPEMIAVWEKCVDISLKEFNALYERLGIEFDYIWGESFYEDKIPEVIQKLEEAKILEQSEGARIVRVTDRSGKELPPCIVVKKDGASIYATRDITAAIYRWEKFHFDRMTYIVGQEQKLHFEQVFGVLRRLGYEWEARCEHVPFGLYRFKDAKMSTRKGNFVTLNEMIGLAQARVRELMLKRDQKPTDFEDIVEKVALGAVIFHDLSVDPSKNVEFDIERVVDFDGETGPYLQYANTRCKSILRKAKEIGLESSELKRMDTLKTLGKPEELALIKTLAQFPNQLERTLQFAKASHLANFMIDLTHTFNAFYRECQVIGDNQEQSQARVYLVSATQKIMSLGLSLLGIPEPERM